MSTPPVAVRKSPMREAFDRIAAKFEAETIPLTRYDVAHLVTLARAQVEGNEPNACGHAMKYLVELVEWTGANKTPAVCLMCEFARSRHGHEVKEHA